MTKAIARSLAAAVILMVGLLNPAVAQDASFDIARFQVEGNTLLPSETVEVLVAPYVGKGKVYGDVQQALEALEGEYRRLGYGTVQVNVPEQELTGGVVRLVVQEGVIGKVTITGNQHFNDENVRASMPDLKEGAAPNMRKLSENIQLSNESPAKQIAVTLGTSAVEGQVDAKVEVKEEDPQRFYVTLDNTGNKATGYARTRCFLPERQPVQQRPGIDRRLHDCCRSPGSHEDRWLAGIAMERRRRRETRYLQCRLPPAPVFTGRQHRLHLRQFQYQHPVRYAGPWQQPGDQRQGRYRCVSLQPQFCARRRIHLEGSAGLRLQVPGQYLQRWRHQDCLTVWQAVRPSPYGRFPPRTAGSGKGRARLSISTSAR